MGDQVAHHLDDDGERAAPAENQVDDAQRPLGKQRLLMDRRDDHPDAVVPGVDPLDEVDAVLLDVGLSSDQLADRSRGFSYDAEGPLDLRFDPTEGEPAWRLVNRLRPETLADLIYEFGEERYSRRIARKIARVRERQPIESARDFARLVASAIPRQSPPPRIHPATRTFQALRIAVNEELKSLQIALERIPTRLRSGGRLVVISFHSLEDRLVKTAFRSPQIWNCLTRSPLEPQADEVETNPRSRSARLRAAVRI